MHTARLILFRLLSFALAAFVLAWVGTATASEAFDSVYELVEQTSGESGPAVTADIGVDDPLDCPAVVSGFTLVSPALLESRAELPPPPFRSILPRPTSPPPRRA